MGSNSPIFHVIYYILISGGFAAACVRSSRTAPDPRSPPLFPSPVPPRKKIHNLPKRLPIKTSPHQCADPGIDPMSSPYLRINCADPAEDSCPGRITVRVLPTSRTRLSKSGGQPAPLSPLPRPGSKRSTRRQNPQRPFIFFFFPCCPNLNVI